MANNSESEEINELKINRNKVKAFKGQITRFKNALQKVSTDLNPDLTQIEERINKIKPILDAFNEAQSNIELLDTLTSEDSHEAVRQSFEDSYFNIISEAKAFLASLSTSAAPGAPSLSNEQTHHTMSSQVKLPPITLPTFDGRYDQWLFFRDTFESLIHKESSIPVINKFHYLRLSLKGQAADLLTSLESSASNYQVAWDLLVKRYENKLLLIKNHIKALFELDAIYKENVLGLRSLVDDTNRHIRALEVLGQPIQHWDGLLVHLLSSKLDPTTRREWENEFSKHSEINFNVFLNFISEKCKILENIQPIQATKPKSNIRGLFSSNVNNVSNHSNSNLNPACFFCSKPHAIYNCKDFLDLCPKDRLAEAKKLKLCLNCLRKNHSFDQCRSSPCRKCKKRHNTLLHFDFSSSNVLQITHDEPNHNNSNIQLTLPVESMTISEQNSNIANSHLSVCSASSEFSHALLSTAMVNVYDNSGLTHTCRVLLDSGSESCFITDNLCKKLNLRVEPTNLSITGIGHTVSTSVKQTSVVVESRQNSFKLRLKCLVLPKLTSQIPNTFINVSQLKIPTNMILADPAYNEPGPIDILIGVEHFYDLLNIGQIKLGKNLPVLQKTQFGWLVTGKIASSENDSFHSSKNKHISCNFAMSNHDLDNNLLKFWEIEEVRAGKVPSHNICEELFSTTTTRHLDGRFIVELPFKHSASLLGDSYANAKSRFLKLEKRLLKNPELKLQYSDFIREYESLGHMSKLTMIDHSTPHFYFPHHCVIKEDSLTTKLRVVFDGSAKTSSGHSLNDILHVGPTIQEDLFSIVLRARKHSIMLTGDLAKMYRQVWVHDQQRKFQLILWRHDPTSEIYTYQLNTVTYGTAPAAFLSTRCLKQLSIDYALTDPEISAIIARDFYIDDLCTGGNSVEEVKYIKSRISEIMQTAGFELRKFACNNLEVLSSSNIENTDNFIELGEACQSKTLGLLWDPKLDIFKYSIKPISGNFWSKRTILSVIAKIYDPLGLLAPVVIIAKLLVQRLWQAKISWDESVPLDVHTAWLNFKSQLDNINHIVIPRHVLIQSPVSIELHGFSDASEVAYGACLYIRSVSSLGQISIQLLCAKTRVAPLKTVTIARLELCAALLLAQLSDKVKRALNLNIDKQFYWCDSNITLSWIKSSPHQWKIFIANRVSQIQSYTTPDDWFYVNTRENPADLLSRGLNPGSLVSEPLWWHGPTWLNKSINEWPQRVFSNSDHSTFDMPEKRAVKPLSFPIVVHDKDDSLFKRFSSFTKLQRVVAYCQRFLRNSKLSIISRSIGPLSVDELNVALKTLIRLVQENAFATDFHNLKKSNSVSNNSKLLSLNPFIDQDNIIRVGGRLQNSNFTYSKKFPIVLPSDHTFSMLLVRFEHIRLLHGGPQLVLSNLRERYWLISGRNLVRKVIRTCVTCSRLNPSKVQYLMGELPIHRVSQCRAFYNVGIDFCGPFLLRDRLTRNFKKIKAYVCLFVCLSTRAVHLELVSDLSTDAFIASLRRFFARRGLSANIYSDHGSNFLGARNEIQRFFNQHKITIQDKLTLDNVKWHFIPPRSPHFGGIWEAGVKSVKFHLKRVLGNAILGFEDFATVLTQIEACLNSRPLSPLSPDCSDFQPLTPAHFLIGQSLMTLPDHNYTEAKEGRLSKFQKLQKIVQHFWQRWSKEYISEMQVRSKWKKNFPNLIQPGVIVLIKEDNLPPLKWQLGVVELVHPGNDGIVRAATIRTSTGSLRRPCTKLCVLPTEA